ncbi:poly-gamma-glutamate biosynthesis protein PgsC [Leptospira gomenensis]|uniref:Poly-gamma-glutamate biosynthesis protein PgsC n=1 Tax=Leptospira gomenensis TaxID=2484974 RepID=A0A5F1YEM6_9LEPT|nr:poly-gamma-glutamate biosynthesis protein PgsC [Leptospira gomenensis]TGK37522.1 poly-gamma-glutamate biosynthesis protein PgsC [Leptospira gomenensis]TGK39472.1 poly-gamma-glutamate biosynthesis protein PgsC [Leptospira gomenensis]TGK43106.1 poly-gamma-glutamate biosynthesis protein PgsC [Leptospira gomenensis]TGK55065.1 poly-gamma-glutamate biosynthesis protein PgsC [Leptospira gomenensis]
MEILTLSIGLGILIGFVFEEKTGIHAGGWIVPGYFALELSDPWFLLIVTLSSFSTYGIYKIAEPHFLSFGNRKIAFVLIVSILISYLLSEVLNQHNAGKRVGTSGFGHLVPGLIALSMEKQGILRTVSGVTVCVCILRMVLILLLGGTF